MTPHIWKEFLARKLARLRALLERRLPVPSPRAIEPIVPAVMPDRHVRRGQDAYAHALAALLPQGIAWPRWPSSVIMRVVHGLCGILGFADNRAADLLEIESDPRKTIELLPDWERNWGLPDVCLPPAITDEERRLLLVKWMTWLGAQSREYFIELMAWLGWVIAIDEWAPFMTGVSRCGDTRPALPPAYSRFRWYVGRPENRFWWTVRVNAAELVWFRTGMQGTAVQPFGSQCGVDHLLDITLPPYFACLLERFKPAHTDIVYDFSNLGSVPGP